MKALITRKIGMTSAIDKDGAAFAVTLLSASPNTLIKTKTAEIDGYDAVQLGFETAKKAGKARAGQFKEAGRVPKVIKEFKLDEIDSDLKIGQKINADIFEVGDQVDVTGVSKGKGFAGTIKRHNFQRGRKTHGGRSYRRPGSIGSMYPQRIFKGKKMAGHMGSERVTAKRLKVAIVDSQMNVIGVKGAVPGSRRGVVLIKKVK